MQATTPIGSFSTRDSCVDSIDGITRPAKLRPISA